MAQKILVVDDEQPIADILKFNLEKEGYEVVCAYDGYEAVELAETEEPDLVLLDIMLPNKDGNEVCREIRKTQTMPIIMLTAKDDEIDKVLGLELGADDYVTKPFSNREVVARVKANLRRQQQVPDDTVKSEEHTSELQSRGHLVCRLLLEKKKSTHARTSRRIQ